MLGSGVSGKVNIFNTDLAVLEAGETRKDLACTVTPTKPALGFDLRFHAGYEVTIPLKDLAGGENLLNILFRVQPKDQLGSAHLLCAAYPCAGIEEDAKATPICRALSISAKANTTLTG